MSLENCCSFLPDGEFQENFSLPDIDSYKRGPLVDAAAYSPGTAAAIGFTVIIAAVTGGGYESFRYAKDKAVIGDTALLIGVVSGQTPIVCQEVSTQYRGAGYSVI